MCCTAIAPALLHPHGCARIAAPALPALAAAAAAGGDPLSAAGARHVHLNERLRVCGVDPDRRVEVSFRRAELERERTKEQNAKQKNR